MTDHASCSNCGGLFPETETPRGIVAIRPKPMDKQVKLKLREIIL